MKMRRIGSALALVALWVSLTSAKPPDFRSISLGGGTEFTQMKLDKYTSMVAGVKHSNTSAPLLYQVYPKFRKISEVGDVAEADPYITIAHERVGSMTRDSRGFIYENGAFSFLPKLFPTDRQVHPRSISNYGVVGGSDSGSARGPNYHVLWTKNSSGEYEALRLPFFLAYINDAGDMVGANKVMLHDGTILSIGAPGFNAKDINNNRQIVGSVWVTDHYEAFVWNPLSGAIPLPPLGNYHDSMSIAINDNGVAVGNSWTDASYAVTLWENGVPRALDPTFKYIFGINNLGQLLVYTTDNTFVLLIHKKQSR